MCPKPHCYFSPVIWGQVLFKVANVGSVRKLPLLHPPVSRMFARNAFTSQPFTPPCSGCKSP